MGHPGFSAGGDASAGESSYYRKTFGGRYTTLEGKDALKSANAI